MMRSCTSRKELFVQIKTRRRALSLPVIPALPSSKGDDKDLVKDTLSISAPPKASPKGDDNQDLVKDALQILNSESLSTMQILGPENFERLEAMLGKEKITTITSFLELLNLISGVHTPTCTSGSKQKRLFKQSMTP